MNATVFTPPVAPASPDWQTVLQAAFTDPAALLAYLELPADTRSFTTTGPQAFKLRVPRGFAARMRKADPQDPLFLQIWPAEAEGLSHPDFVSDAVGDLHKLRGDGIIHKYQGRALMVVTGACAVHCRYCFRKHFPYGDAHAGRSQWQGALGLLASDPSIEEIILSGGDPLSLNDEKFAALLAGLEAIPHLKRLRIHSRQPIVLPERVTPALVSLLANSRFAPVLVLHANHAQELSPEVAAALTALRGAGVTLLNQSVLLKNVNDSAAALKALSEQLFAVGVLPYYLHLLDKVDGAAHFEVTESRAVSLLSEISAQLPGYLVPRLVREEAGAPSKTWISA